MISLDFLVSLSLLLFSFLFLLGFFPFSFSSVFFFSFFFECRRKRIGFVRIEAKEDRSDRSSAEVAI